MNVFYDIISWGITGIPGFIISTIYFNKDYIKYLYIQSIIMLRNKSLTFWMSIKPTGSFAFLLI